MYRFQPTVTAPSGSTLVFAISGKPSWAAFDSSTGLLAGTPTDTQIGTYSNIAIKVTSDTKSASLAPFSISVTGLANVAPLISGQPAASVTVGASYNFAPTASDANGDTLSFNVQNLPTWASFDTRSGHLSGTPTAGDVGSYANIIIAVSDGKVTSTLAPFAISVLQQALGAALLNWTPPTQNSDGSTLADLAGYRIYYGTAPGNLSQSIDINNPGIASFTVENLAPATWYFAVSAYTSAGLISAPTNAVSATIK
jgi:hypothetical protein